jgi:uncharacterized membrane protein HdeD (DUF308 family)
MWWRRVVGAVLCLVGILWFAQGVGMGSSGMSGHAQWAVVGAVLFLGGLVLVRSSLRVRAESRD